LKPWRKRRWCIPPRQNAAFVCAMENVLEVYHRPYDPRRPVVGMDEQPKQLIAETRTPISVAPGQSAKIDYEYRRHGVASVWMFSEPLAGWRKVNVTERRTAVDWAHQMRELVDVHYPDAERVTVVLDNLNTHTLASLYEAFEPAEARRIAEKLELVYTPKHGSWLNVAEIELSVLSRQCLDRRMPERSMIAREAAAWEDRRNQQACTIDWRFTTDDARIKLKRLYPKTLA
jgi:hypothetical protein